MNKVLKLASILRKCNKKIDMDENKDETTIDISGIKEYLFPIIVSVIGFLVGIFFMQIPGASLFFPSPVIVLSLIMILITIITIILSFIKVINNFYLADDLPQYLTLPFSQFDITFAKIYNIAISQYINAFALLVPISVGMTFSIGTSFQYWISLLIGLITIPIAILSIIAILVMIIIASVHVVRNKNLIRILGAIIAGVALIVGYIGYTYMCSQQDVSTEEIIAGISNGYNSIVSAFPHVKWITSFATTGEIITTLLVVIGTVCLVVLFAIVSKFTYFKGALAMQSSSTYGKEMSEGKIKKIIKKKTLIQTLTITDVKSILFNPDFLLRFALMPIVFPVMVVVMISSIPSEAITSQLSGLTAGSTAALVLGICMPFFSYSSLNSAMTGLSREGMSFDYLKTLPIAGSDMIRGKRNSSIIISSIGTVVLTTCYFLVLGVMGITPIYNFIFAFIGCICSSIVISDIQLIDDFKEPNFIWNSAAEIKKPRISTMLKGLLVLLYGISVFIIIVVVRLLTNFNVVGLIVTVAFMILTVMLSCFLNKRILLKANKYYNSL